MKKLAGLLLIVLLLVTFGSYIVPRETKTSSHVRKYDQPQLFGGRLDYAVFTNGQVSINYKRSVFSRNILICTNDKGKITDIIWDTYLPSRGLDLWITPPKFKHHPWLVAQAKIALEKGNTLKSRLPAPTNAFLANQKLAR